MHISAIKQSKYLARNDVGDGMNVTIRSIDQANVAMEGEAPEMKYVLHFAEPIKAMVLNNINAQLIALALGSEETDDWLGQKVCLFDDKTVQFGGKLVGGIRVRAVGQPAPAPARSAATPPKSTATDKTRLWALNLLMAGPGQTNRQMVTDYLAAHALIKPGEEPESWQLDTVPTSKASVATLASAIEEWARTESDVPF